MARRADDPPPPDVKLNGVPKDTKTRCQGIYARHQLGCAIDAGRSCNCTPSYWGQVWDRAVGKARKTKRLQSIAAARNARADLEATLRAGMLPASSTMRLAVAIEAYPEAIRAGTALNKHGRRYKPSAIRDIEEPCSSTSSRTSAPTVSETSAAAMSSA